MTKTYYQQRAEKLLKRAAEQFDVGSKELENVMTNFAGVLIVPETVEESQTEEKPTGIFNLFRG